MDFQETSRLERENSNLNQRLSVMASEHSELQLELETLESLRDGAQVGALPASEDEEASRISELEAKAEVLAQANKDLQDQNDELSLQMEAMKAQQGNR